MKTKKNNLGFGTHEMLTVVMVCLILSACLLMYVVQSSDNEKYRVMRYNARIFGINTTTYQVDNSDNTVYLRELMDSELLSEIVNPFQGDSICDPYESKVTVKEEKRFITLKCGNYLIDDQYIGADTYKIYKVGPWQLVDLGKESEEKTVYNYKEKKKDVFPNYYEEEMFLYLFNSKQRMTYNSIKAIPKRYGILEKKLYRTKVLVKEESKDKKSLLK